MRTADNDLVPETVQAGRRRLVMGGALGLGAASFWLLGGCTPVTRERAATLPGAISDGAASGAAAGAGEQPPVDDCPAPSSEPPTEEIGAVDWEKQFEITTAQVQERLMSELEGAGKLGEEIALSLRVAVFFYFTAGTPILDPRSALEGIIYEETRALQERLIEDGLPKEQAQQIVISRLDLTPEYELMLASQPFAPNAVQSARPLLRVASCWVDYSHQDQGYCIERCRTTYSC